MPGGHNNRENQIVPMISFCSMGFSWSCWPNSLRYLLFFVLYPFLFQFAPLHMGSFSSSQKHTYFFKRRCWLAQAGSNFLPNGILAWWVSGWLRSGPLGRAFPRAAPSLKCHLLSQACFGVVGFWPISLAMAAGLYVSLVLDDLQMVFCPLPPFLTKKSCSSQEHNGCCF